VGSTALLACMEPGKHQRSCGAPASAAVKCELARCFTLSRSYVKTVGDAYRGMALYHSRTFSRTRALDGAKRTAHHSFKDDSIQAPVTTQATPAVRAIHRPTGVSFSKRTSSERSAIQSTFITPPTNKSAIRTQQQPTQ
jgi:hypothetical protein